MSGLDLDLKGYLDAGYRSEPDVLSQIGPAASRKDSLLDLANRRYTSIVDLKTILSLKDRAQTLGSEVSVRYARDLRPNDSRRAMSFCSVHPRPIHGMNSMNTI
jgi:hypothetical protein